MCLSLFFTVSFSYLPVSLLIALSSLCMYLFCTVFYFCHSNSFSFSVSLW